MNAFANLINIYADAGLWILLFATPCLYLYYKRECKIRQARVEDWAQHFGVTVEEAKKTLYPDS